MVDEARGSEKKAKKSTTDSATPAKTINKEMSPSSSAIDEKSISSAMRSRVEYFKEQADSLTLEGVRRVLEKDLGLDKYALDAHKRFIKECLQECFDAGSNENVSKSSGETGEEVINSMKEETLDLSGNHPPDQTPKGLEDKENVLESPVPAPLAGVDTAPDGTKKTEGLPRAKAISEETVKNIIRKRASYFRNHSETLTLVGVRRLLEQDLKLEKHALDAYRELIKEQLDKVLQSSGVTEPANGVKNKKRRKVTSGGDSDSSDSVDEMEDEEVKPKKRIAPKQKMNVSGGLKNRKGPSKETAKASNSNKRKKPAESISEETDDAKDGGDLSDDGQSQSSGDKSVKIDTDMRGRGRSYGRGSHGASSLAADESPQPNPDQQQVALEPRVEGEKTTVEPNVMWTKLLDSGKVSRRLLKIFRSRWFVEGSAWKKLPGEHRKFYFDEFKKYFRWEACYTDDNIMDVFFKHAASRYADTICKMRTTGKKDPSVDEAVWAVWVQEWATDDFKQKSDTARSNRLSEPSGPGTGPSRHTGGSRSAILHQKALATVLGREPTLVEMLVHTHTKKSDRTVFVDERARQVHDRYNELVAAASQTVEGAAESSQIDENKLYLEAVDGIKKQRIYGVGSCASSYIAASSPSTAGTQQRGYKSQLREEIRNELREEIRNTYHQHFLQKQSLGVSADEKIHNVPLGESNVRVAVEYVIAPNALLPVPVVGEMTMVKDAIGSFVAWPKEFVLSGAEEVENQAAGEESGPIQAFASFVDQMVQTDNIIIPVQSAIFEAEFEAHLHKDHLFSLCNMQELTDSCIITYIRYLYVNLTSTQGRYAFVNPSSMNSARGTPASSVVTKRLQLAEKDQLVFVPYKTKGHWVLIIIDSSSMDVYWLDPLRKPLPMDVKIYLTMGLKALQTDGKKRPHPVWHCVKCPKQSLDVQCGYHVMRYMKELLEESNQPLAEKILQLGQKETYTQDETDEVRLEFIDFVLAHI